MTPTGNNIHATAIVIGNKGLLFTGPSGSGKSMMAFACIAAAKRQGMYAALVADDQVLVSGSGDHVIAQCPKATAGLIELRGSGIVRIESVETTTLDLAIRLVSIPEDDRLPPENERFTISGIGDLRQIRLWNANPEPLASIAALVPELFQTASRRSDGIPIF